MNEYTVCGQAMAVIGMAFYIGTVPHFDERPTWGLLVYVGVVTALWSAYMVFAALRYRRRLSDVLRETMRRGNVSRLADTT